MPINKQLIFEALNKRPLCHGHLIAQKGLAIEYCAMGALAMDVGATNEYLTNEANDGRADGSGIWSDYREQLQSKFGFVDLKQFQTLMNANDAESFATRRNKRVCETVEALSGEEVNAIMESHSFCTEQVDTTN